MNQDSLPKTGRGASEGLEPGVTPEGGPAASPQAEEGRRGYLQVTGDLPAKMIYDTVLGADLGFLDGIIDLANRIRSSVNK
jgi:hypothetical protein